MLPLESFFCDHIALDTSVEGLREIIRGGGAAAEERIII